MKKTLSKTAGLLACGVLLFASGTIRAADAKVKKPTPPAEYKVDVKASELRWLAKKVTGQHNGTVAIKSGRIQVQDGVVTGGEVVVDMTSLKDLDVTDPKHNKKLTDHLKSDDFFGVEKHPTAVFLIQSGKPTPDAAVNDSRQTVSGELTIKGITHPTSFPVLVSIDAKEMRASGKDIKVDRTLYDIRYGSGKFFENLGNKMIDDEFTLDFDIVATPK